MAVKIRFTRTGKKNYPSWRIAVFEDTQRRDGPYIEQLGWYDPHQKEAPQKVKIDKERYDHWVKNGAKPTEAVQDVLKHVGILTSESLKGGTKSRKTAKSH